MSLARGSSPQTEARAAERMLCAKTARSDAWRNRRRSQGRNGERLRLSGKVRGEPRRTSSRRCIAVIESTFATKLVMYTCVGGVQAMRRRASGLGSR